MAISTCISLSSSTSPFLIDETGRHGTKEFPVAIYHDDVTDDSVNLHWHAEIEIGTIEEGEVLLECESRKYALKKGDVFFVNTNVLHAMKSLSGGNKAIFHSIAFDSSIISSNPESVFYKKYLDPIIHNSSFREAVFVTGSKDLEVLSEIVSSCYNAVLEESEAFEIEVRNGLSKFLAILLDMSKTAQKSDEKSNLLLNDRIQKILNYIHLNYAKDVTLDDLAKASNVSKSEVNRCFKKVLNLSPIKYLKNLRLKNAAYLLKNSTESIQTIYEKCGFEDNSYFSKSFKEVYHVSPRAYREN